MINQVRRGSQRLSSQSPLKAKTLLLDGKERENKMNSYPKKKQKESPSYRASMRGTGIAVF